MAHYNPVAGLQRILAQITSTCDWVFRLGGSVLDSQGLFAFVVYRACAGLSLRRC